MAGRADRILAKQVETLRRQAELLRDAGKPDEAGRALHALRALRGSTSDQQRQAGAIITALVVAAEPEDRDPEAFRAAIRHLCQVLGDAHPGQAIEVRVPPVAAVQLGSLDAGPTHTRGTPPNVVETDAETWFALATGTLTWDAARASAKLRSSGAHADEVARMLPVRY